MCLSLSSGPGSVGLCGELGVPSSGRVMRGFGRPPSGQHVEAGRAVKLTRGQCRLLEAMQPPFQAKLSSSQSPGGAVMLWTRAGVGSWTGQRRGGWVQSLASSFIGLWPLQSQTCAVCTLSRELSGRECIYHLHTGGAPAKTTVGPACSQRRAECRQGLGERIQPCSRLFSRLWVGSSSPFPWP